MTVVTAFGVTTADAQLLFTYTDATLLVVPVHAVAPGAPAGASWASLHAAHDLTGKPGNRPRFKNWMTDTYGADYSGESLRAAALKRSTERRPA